MKVVNGWLDRARVVNSPNFNQRANADAISLLVIHNISLPPCQFDKPYIELFFQNKLPVVDHPYFKELEGLEVSSHFLIKRSGEIVQFVSCNERAWHAGASEFCGSKNCNDFSIGIELEGTDHILYEPKQYETLAALTLALQLAYPLITNENIVGHSDISPGRKTDPGNSFDWQHYRHLLSVS